MAVYVPGSFDTRAGILGDLAYVDDTETVTVEQPGVRVGSGFTVANVVRESIAITYVDAGGASVPGTLIRFWLGFAECQAEPLMSARIIDADGVAYRVGDHEKEVMRLAYRADCARET